MTVAVTGAHGAGKSTLCRALAATLGWPFHGEIGWELAQQRRVRGEDASQRQDAFDDRVFRQELARDTDTSGPRVVESWHPGNLAYAAMRSPDVAGRWLAEVRRASDACALVVHLTASRETLAARQHEPGPASFFHEVGEEALEWSRRLGLRVLVLDSAVLDPDALLLAVLDGLHERNR